MKAIKALYIGASVMLTVHGIFHVWQDLMLLSPEQNPLEFLFGRGQFGLAIHIIEWPVLFTALALGYLREGDEGGESRRHPVKGLESQTESSPSGSYPLVPRTPLRKGFHPQNDGDVLDLLEFGGGGSGTG